MSGCLSFIGVGRARGSGGEGKWEMGNGKESSERRRKADPCEIASLLRRFDSSDFISSLFQKYKNLYPVKLLTIGVVAYL